MRVLFFLFFCLSTVQSQKTLLKGSVIDSETKQPVVYANISFLKSNKGISSNEDGTFSLEIDKELLNDKVHISCLNYKDTIVSAFDLQNKNLAMQSKNEILNEVVISKKKNKKIILDKVKRRVIPLYSGDVVKMTAKYFPANYPKGYYLEEIKLHFSRRGSRKSKFRIRIFSVDSISGKPKEDLLLKNLPITIEEKQKVAIINLEDLFLEAPSNGFYVAFEKLFIPENKFIEKKSFKKNYVWYSPTIGLTKNKEFSKENCKVYLYRKGKWWLNPKFDKEDRWIPAISVTLSN